MYAPRPTLPRAGQSTGAVGLGPIRDRLRAFMKSFQRAGQIAQDLIAIPRLGKPRFTQLRLEGESAIRRFLDGGGRILRAIDGVEI